MRLNTLIKIAAALTLLARMDVSASAQTTGFENLTLQPGDHLRITVLGEDKDLSGEFEVAPDGTLKHPLYNQIKVVGVPLPMLRDRFVTFLKRFQKDPQVQVEPLLKVGVSGEVKTPNIYFLAPETTVAEALTHANGATDRGDADHVTLLREGKEIPLDLSRASVSRDPLTIRSGDQINVDPRRSVMSGIGTLTPLLTVAASLVSVTIILLNHR